MGAQDVRKVEFNHVSAIEVHGRLRQLHDDSVEALAGSMERIGLRTPISVRYYSERPVGMVRGETDDALVLMTGAHRLAAAKRLGWEKIECFVYYEGDEIDAQLWEIAENLHRAELTALERDEQVARWMDLNARRIVTTGDNSKPGPKGAEREAAKELGVGRMAVNRAVKVASLTDEAKEAARELGLDDNRSALLDAAKAETPGEQVARLHARAKPRKIVRVADAPLDDEAAQERQVAALMAAWNKASAEARQEFLSRIDTPVFDRSAAA